MDGINACENIDSGVINIPLNKYRGRKVLFCSSIDARILQHDFIELILVIKILEVGKVIGQLK